LIVFQYNNTCLTCGKHYTYVNGNYIHWCKVCSVKYIQENLCTWSGNEKIDNFIKEKQQIATCPLEFFEWIPYNQFEIIKQVGKEKFFTIYSAEWKGGYLNEYNEENHEFRRCNKGVALKCLNNCKNNDDKFLHEVFYLFY
jgi:hypothetical protein